MFVARTFSTTADTALVNNAVNMATASRIDRAATILHADHGTQFTSWSFGENMRRWGLLASFGTVGDCYDCRHGVILGAPAGRATQHPQVGDHLRVGRDDG